MLIKDLPPMAAGPVVWALSGVISKCMVESIWELFDDRKSSHKFNNLYHNEMSITIFFVILKRISFTKSWHHDSSECDGQNAASLSFYRILAVWTSGPGNSTEHLDLPCRYCWPRCFWSVVLVFLIHSSFLMSPMSTYELRSSIDSSNMRPVSIIYDFGCISSHKYLNIVFQHFQSFKRMISTCREIGDL